MRNRFSFFILLMLVLGLFSISVPAQALGKNEGVTDPLYGAEFPKRVKSSTSLPDPVEYGPIVLSGVVVSIGNVPFTRWALRVEAGAEAGAEAEAEPYYYILPDITEESAQDLADDGAITLQGQLSIEATYFIDRRLALIEYYLRNSKQM